MPSPLLTISVETRGLVAALSRLGSRADARLHAASKQSALAVQREARVRLERQVSGGSTGQTAEGVTAKDDGDAWLVYVDIPAERWQNLDIGLEFGTSRMRERPFLHQAAILEEGPHRRRIVRAIEELIEEVGLGG